MRDIDVRTVLAAEVARRYKGDADTLIIHELGVCSGDARIDLAVVNGKLHGYEHRQGGIREPGNAFGASGTEAKSITESDGYRPTALAGGSPQST